MREHRVTLSKSDFSTLTQHLILLLNGRMFIWSVHVHSWNKPSVKTHVTNHWVFLAVENVSGPVGTEACVSYRECVNRSNQMYTL